MERERWAVISMSISDVARSRRSGPRFTHCISLVARVLLWAVLHDRPISWACKRNAWDHRTRPARLPSQSTMSRRLRRPEVMDFLLAMLRRLEDRTLAQSLNVKLMDAKALTISSNTRDPDCPKRGRAGNGLARGYKFYCIWGNGFVPEAWEVRPIHEAEVTVAREALIPRLHRPDSGVGLLLADHLYDANALYELSCQHGHRLLAPRRYEKAKPKARLGHHRHSPLRIWALRAQRRLSPRRRHRLQRRRRRIERRFAMLTSLMVNLPPWIRRLHRVRLWVAGKLIANAARLRTAKRVLDA